MQRRWLFAVAAVLCTGQIDGAARAQALRWDVERGFDGVHRAGAWTPVFVNIENTGESQTGEVVIPVEYGQGRGQGSARTVNYAVPVDLPRNSKKRYALYVPGEASGESVWLMLGPAGTAEERELPAGRQADREDALVVTIGGDRGLLNFLSGVEAAGRVTWTEDPGQLHPSGSFSQERSVIEVGHTTWRDLPDSWLGWDGVDAVVLGDAGFAAASGEALEALLLWVEQGGTLVVPGGALSPEMAASPISRMLPIRVAGTAALPSLHEVGSWVDHPMPSQPVLVATGSLAEDAALLCGTTDRPIIAVRRAGSGRIVMTAFDFAAAPVKYWDGQTALWRHLLAESASRTSLASDIERAASRTHRHSPLISLADAASYTPAGRLPPIWLLVGFLGAYILALVPGNYFLLRRLDRRGLAWVTTPAIIVVFTAAAYGLGHRLRGGAIVLNRLAVVETMPNARLARGRGFVGLFSPARSVYELALKGTAAGARDITPPEQRARGTASVRYEPTPRITDLAMNMWTSRTFCVDFLTDLGGGIAAAGEWDGTALRASVENNSDLRLRECRLIRDSTEGPRKSIKSGQKAELSLSGGRPIGDRSFYSARHLSGADARQAVTDLAMRSLFGDGSQYRYGPPSMSLSAVPRVCVAALADGPLVPVELLGGKPRINDVGLVIVRLPLHLAEGSHIPVPSSLIARRLIGHDGNVVPVDQMPDLGVRIESGSAVFEFQVPLGERGGAAESLVLCAPGRLESPAAGPQGASQGPQPRRGRPAGISPRGGRAGTAGGRRAGRGARVAPAAPARPATGAKAGLEIFAYDWTSGDWRLVSTQHVQSLALPRPARQMSPDGRVLVKLSAPDAIATFDELRIEAEVTTPQEAPR